MSATPDKPSKPATNGSSAPQGKPGRFVTEAGRRYRHVTKLWQTEGPRHVGQRIVRAAVNRLDPPVEIPAYSRAEVIAADLDHPFTPELLPLGPDERLRLNWVVLAPSLGSGGHTTIFRLIQYLDAQGHQSRIFIYDPYGSDARYFETIIRTMAPEVTAEVVDLEAGLPDAHATIATFWSTAYPVFNARNKGARCYLVQDFEPSFYPVSSNSVLADNTYRMGFHAITAGRWLAEKLADEYGMKTDWFDFGCDTERYHLLQDPQAPGVRRDGIVFYARPDAPRRGFEIGVLALAAFAERHPEVDIHVYGQNLGPQSFRFIDHGLCTPDELNALYNRCYVGLSLSLTNVSLVPHEMLSAGCIPVVNDAHHNRIVLDNDHVQYAPPSPVALAEALAGIVTDPDFASRAAIASTSVGSSSWDAAGAATEAALRRAATG